RRRCGGTSLPASHARTVAATRRSSVGPAAVAGVVVGVAAAVAVAATWTGGTTERGKPHDAAPAYVADWRRSQLATWKVVLRRQLLGPKRLYDVTATSPHCYEFGLRVNYPAPPYGRRARFCFDQATGAPTLRDVQRPQGRDVQDAVSVSGQVDDADLAPPPGIKG